MSRATTIGRDFLTSQTYHLQLLSTTCSSLGQPVNSSQSLSTSPFPTHINSQHNNPTPSHLQPRHRSKSSTSARCHHGRYLPPRPVPQPNHHVCRPPRRPDPLLRCHDGPLSHQFYGPRFSPPTCRRQLHPRFVLGPVDSLFVEESSKDAVMGCPARP